MFCYNCGSGIVEGSKFCASCGSAVRENENNQLQNDRVDQQPQPFYPNEPLVQPDYQQSNELPAQPDYRQPDEPPIQPVYPYHTTAQPDYQQQYQPNAQPTFQQAYQPYAPYQPLELPKKGKQVKGLWWKVAIPAVFLISLITVGVFYLVTLISPLTSMSLSIYNLRKEFEQRIEDTPMELFGMLYDSFESGSITVDFQYSDYWNDTSGIITLHTDDRPNETAIEIDISTGGFAIDLELYSNRERIAARISQIDNNFYGIRYKTFKDDFLPFANLLFLDQDDIDMITGIVEFIANAMEAPEESESPYSKYGELIRTAIDRADFSDERVDFVSNGRNIRVNKMEFTISDQMIIELLSDLLDLLENDDYIRSLFEMGYDIQSGALPYNSSPAFDEIIREMRNGIRDLERELRGEVKIAFYIGSRNRLMRIEVDFDFIYDGDHTEFDLSLDFGSSAQDVWVYSFNSRDFSDSTSYSISWNIRETSRGGETMLTINSENRHGSETFAVILDWNDRGKFTLTSRDANSHDTLLTGIYTKINDGFSLEIDNPFDDSRQEENLQLKISAISRSGHIKEIDFINIADWDLSLVQKFGGFVAGFGNTNTPPIF